MITWLVIVTTLLDLRVLRSIHAMLRGVDDSSLEEPVEAMGLIASTSRIHRYGSQSSVLAPLLVLQRRALRPARMEWSR
jgi:hypothetical protein